MDIIVPIITALIAGAFAYFGARLQSRTERDKITAENARLKAQLGEERVTERKASYRELLAASDRYGAERKQQRLLPTHILAGWVERHRAELAEVVGAVAITGTGEVADRARALYDEQVADCREAEVKALRARLVEAMRRDVAPEVIDSS
jgi:cobalamin-dependent methionine synthase I